MIKRFGFVAFFVMFALLANVGLAQKAADKGSAVKLGTRATVKNTIIWGNEGKTPEGITPETSYIQGIQTGSPKFVDSLNGDFRITKQSLCRDKGSDDSFFGAAALDLWGNKRKTDQIDIGAHEYKIYKIHFIKDEQVKVIELPVNGVNSDSTEVEPNGTYQFKLDLGNIQGVTEDMVIVKKVVGDEKLDPEGVDNVYTLTGVNSDITIQVILTPPLMVTVEIPTHGKLSATSQQEGLVVPKADGSGKNSMVVAADEFIRFDTVPDAGYYCNDVWVQEVGAAGKTSVKANVGKPDGWKVTKSLVCSAEFLPKHYPVQLKVNDRTMGGLTLTDSKGGVYALPVGDASLTAQVVYDPTLFFSIAITPTPGYEVEAITVYDADGVSNPQSLSVGQLTGQKTAMRVGGIVVALKMKAKKHVVSWNCQNGDLTVVPGTVEIIPGGGKKIETGYNTEIMVTPVAAEGYEYVIGSLKVKPEGEAEVVMPATNKWQVKKNVTLSAQFTKKKYLITVNIAGDPSNNYTANPVLPADHKVEHGTALTLTPQPATGYHCTNPTPVYYPEVKEDKTVTFTFVRNDYQVVYNTPDHGTLNVEWQDKGGSAWNNFAGSPGTVYYQDNLKITATPEAHYTLKTLTITPDGEVPVTAPNGNYTVTGVTKNLTIYAEFKPIKYDVTLQKTGVSGSGEVVLKNGAVILGKLDKNTSQKSITGIPYNTVLTVEVLTDVNYTCDQLTAGGTDILSSRSFTLTQTTNVIANIKYDATAFVVTKQAATPEGSDLKVTDGIGGNEIIYGNLYSNGTLLQVKAVQAAGDTCVWIKANGVLLADGDTYAVSGENVHFTAGFAKKCTIRIADVPGASITVKKDGVALPDGSIVPAGSALQVEMVADAGSGCKQVKIDGDEKWQKTIIPTMAPLATSGVISYVIPAGHAVGEIWFEGSAGRYYSVKYTPAHYGSLQVFAGAVLLNAGTSYWYEAGENISIKATESVAGYQLNADRKVVNNADIANPIILSWVDAAHNYQYTIQALDRDLNLTALFEVKQYDVDLVITLPSGKILAEVASVTLAGGTPQLTAQGTTSVQHGSTLTLSVSPQSGYAIRILDGTDIKQTGTTALMYVTPAITAPRTLTVEIKPLYQVFYSSNIAGVTRADGTALQSGDWAYEGEDLKALSITPPVGKKGKLLTVKNQLTTQVVASSSAPLSNGTLECTFVMPAASVEVEAEFQPLTYNMSLVQDSPVGAGTVQVYKTEGGVNTPLAAGAGVLSYGDQLKVVVILSKDWYRIESLVVQMNGTSIGTTYSAAGLTHTYVLDIPVAGDVNIAAVLKRRMQNLIVRVNPGDNGFAVKVQVDEGSPVEYTQGYQAIQVPAGAEVEAWPLISPASEGYELNYFPGAGLKKDYVQATVPSNSDLSISALFTLKQYPLSIKTSPIAAGMVKVQDNQSNNYKHADKIPYGTNLATINVLPVSDYYRFDRITGFMSGVDRLAGQSSPYHIDKVVDTVRIEATFNRLYKVLKETAVNGTMNIYEGGTSTVADGRFFPAATMLSLQVIPIDESYKCSLVQLLFPGTSLLVRTLSPDADGRLDYTIPAGLEATDLKFQAFFVKKEHKVKLKREPAEGGDAELWQGEKPTGTLLLSLMKDDPQTEIEANVAHGTVLNFYETASAPDYEVARKVTGASTVYTGAVTLNSDTIFLVRFGKLYTINIVDPGTIHVYYKDTGVEITSGTKIAAGTALRVEAAKTGHNYTLLSVLKTDNTTAMSWDTPDADGVIEQEFTMPDFDVKITGVTEPKKYTVTVVQPAPVGYTSVAVETVPASGAGITVNSGDKVEYLTSLLAKFVPHSWYEVGSFTATVGGLPRGVENPAGILKIDGIDGDVLITAVSVRKQKKMTIKLVTELLADGNKVIVQTEDGIEHTFTADGDMLVNVGAPVKVWTVTGQGSKVVSLSPVPGSPVTTAPYELVIDNMPDAEMTVTANFELKTYPVYFTSTTGGTVVVKKHFNGVNEGVITVSGEEVKHFTELTIEPVAASNRYQLVSNGLDSKMGGISVADPRHIPVVEDEVNINASFERIYEIRLVPSVNGEITVSRADTNAVGWRYPAGTLLRIESVADEGYELESLTMNGVSQTKGPDGEYTCVVPDNVAVDSVEFEASYTLKKYKITYIVSGEGALEVGGLPGGTQTIEKVTLTSSNIPHFTQLSLSVVPKSENYRVSRFIIHFFDGTQKSVAGTDTTVVITGNSTVEVEFAKYYWVIYDAAPQHGSLTVKVNGVPVVSGDRYPAGTTFGLETLPDQGYQRKSLTVNGEEMQNDSYYLDENASFDTLYIGAAFEIITYQLTALVPDSAWIKVQGYDTADAEWKDLDVANPVTLDYGTQLRITAGVYNEYGFELRSLKVNGSEIADGMWRMTEDSHVVVEINVRSFSVVWQEPLHGRLEVETGAGSFLSSGARVPYRTELTVSALPDDPIGYEVRWLSANGNQIDNGDSWSVLEDVELRGAIGLRRWEVTSSLTGKGELSLYRQNGSVIQSPVDSVEHYEILKIVPKAEPGWMLYSLDVYGANLHADTVFSVVGDAQVVAVFREREKYLFPVAFTPNGDGYNDLWEVGGLWQAPHNTLEIYNRDQKRIYKASPYINEWGGTTDNGNVLPAGTYIYKFIVSPGGEEFMGFVSIVRD